MTSPTNNTLGDSPGMVIRPPAGDPKCTIISFYTDDYCGHANKLFTSIIEGQLVNAGYAVAILGMPESGSWQRNCNRKSQYVYQSLSEYKTPVLWVDADAVINGPLTYIDELLTDPDVPTFSALMRAKPSHPWNTLQSGTLFFDYSDQAMRLVDRWMHHAIENPHTWDQVNLHHAYQDVAADDGFTFVNLPESYCHINGHTHNYAPVIVHNQASRQLKPLKDSGDAEHC